MRFNHLFLLFLISSFPSAQALALSLETGDSPAQMDDEDEDEDEKDEDKDEDKPIESRSFRNVFGSSAKAAPIAKPGLTAVVPSKSSPPWAGSSITWGNSTRAVGLQKDSLLTWNPYYAMSFSLQPRYKLPYVSLSASLGFSSQLTQADDHLPTSFSDPSLTVSPAKSFEIPQTGIKLSGSGSLALGLSPYSRAAGQSASVTGRLSLARGFSYNGVKMGLNMGTSVTGYQTATQQGTTARAVGPACVQGLSAFAEMPDDCSGFFVHDGSPNKRYKRGFNLGASVTPLKWLTVSLGTGLSSTEVYAMAVDDPRISNRPVTPVTTRYYQAFSLGARLGPWKGFGANLGYGTAGPQLSPSAQPYDLTYNRFTMLSLALSYQL